VVDDQQPIGRIRYASERSPGIWLWNIQVHIAVVKPMGTANDLEAAKAAFKEAWASFKAEHAAALPAAYRAANIRDGG
jgi:hypothetical protein